MARARLRPSLMGGQVTTPMSAPSPSKKGRSYWGRNFRDSPRSRNVTNLFARLLLAFLASLLVFLVGTVLIWAFESGQKGTDIHGFGDAAFFTAVQLLTVSSSAKNPLTSGGK